MGKYTALFERLSSETSSMYNAILNPQSCHTFVTQKCLNCGKSWVSNLPCGNKLCSDCAMKRSRKNHYVVFAILCSLGLLSQAHKLKFVTLTLKNVSSVAVGYAKLRRCFGELQRRVIWKNAFYGRKNSNGKRLKGWSVRGGCGNFETTNKGHGYHVHLHLLLDCDFIPQKQLSALWLKITGDSMIVDVRGCSGTKEAIYEISKYSFKPADADLWSDTMKQDFNAALKDKVLFFRFGSWRNVTLEKRVSVCGFCGSSNIMTLDFETPEVRDMVNSPILVYEDKGGGNITSPRGLDLYTDGERVSSL